MQSHIEDKIEAKVEDYQQVSQRKTVLEAKRLEMLSYERYYKSVRALIGAQIKIILIPDHFMSRPQAAQSIAVEISILVADMHQINSEIKDMQRESYFLGLDRKRKKLIAQKLKSDISETKMQMAIQKKLSAKIKKEGFMGALKTLNKLQNAEIGGSLKDNQIINSIVDDFIISEDGGDDGRRDSCDNSDEGEEREDDNQDEELDDQNLEIEEAGRRSAGKRERGQGEREQSDSSIINPGFHVNYNISDQAVRPSSPSSTLLLTTPHATTADPMQFNVSYDGYSLLDDQLGLTYEQNNRTDHYKDDDRCDFSLNGRSHDNQNISQNDRLNEIEIEIESLAGHRFSVVSAGGAGFAAVRAVKSGEHHLFLSAVDTGDTGNVEKNSVTELAFVE